MGSGSACRPRCVLCASLDNSARSLMAEAWLRQLGGAAVEISSAGTPPEVAPDPELDGTSEVAEWSFDDPSAIDAPDQATRRRADGRGSHELRTRVSLFVNATTETSGARNRVNADARPDTN